MERLERRLDAHWEEAKSKKLQQRLRDSLSVVFAASVTIFEDLWDEDVFGDLLWDEPSG